MEFVQVETLLPDSPASGPGRPRESRAALGRAFLAKAVFDLPTTRALVERLAADPALRRLCGWQGVGAVPSEATFSRAFAAFADSKLAEQLHEALLERTLQGHSAGHLSRDSTAIPAREKTARKSKPVQQKRKRGRPPKGEQRPPQPTRLQRQATMTLAELLEDLPTVCDRGAQRNAKGYIKTWNGYKLHIDSFDGGIPVSCWLTSPSLQDSPAALPLAKLTAGRVDNL